jgi:hypothetical protein
MANDRKPADRLSLALAAALSALVLQGCAATASPIVTREVQVPVAISCVPPGVKLSDGYPDTAEALKGAPNLAERVKLLLEGRALRDADLVQLRPLLKACGGG